MHIPIGNNSEVINRVMYLGPAGEALLKAFHTGSTAARSREQEWLKKYNQPQYVYQVKSLL